MITPLMAMPLAILDTPIDAFHLMPSHFRHAFMLIHCCRRHCRHAAIALFAMLPFIFYAYDTPHY